MVMCKSPPAFTGRKKLMFSKVVPRPLEMLHQGFLAYVEPVVTRFGPLEMPKCLKNGLFWDPPCAKNAFSQT